MKYAYLENNTKKLLGWYSDDVHSAIPIDSIAVEDEIWQEAININANCYENGKFIRKEFRTAEEIEKQRVLDIKAKAKAYLRDTDWVKSYELEHRLGINVIPDNSSKWEIINKRNEYISFLNNIDSN